jgi:hypothetical protein
MAGDCEIVLLKRIPETKLRLQLAAVAADPKPLEEENGENSEDFEENEDKTGRELTKQPENATVPRHSSAAVAELTQPAADASRAAATTNGDPMTPTTTNLPSAPVLTDPPQAPPSRRPTAADLRAARQDCPDSMGTDNPEAQLDPGDQGSKPVPMHKWRHGFFFGVMTGGIVMAGLWQIVRVVAPDDDYATGFADGLKATTSEAVATESPVAVEPGQAEPAVEPAPAPEPPPAAPAPAPEAWICDTVSQVEWSGSPEAGWTLTCGKTTWSCPPAAADHNYTRAECTQLR